MISTPERGETVVGTGQTASLRGSGTLVARGLGSAVAVLLHDSAHRVGGLAHVALPAKVFANDHANLARFAETAVPSLLDQVVERGADRADVVARIVGGATMFDELMPQGTIHIGQRNIAACRAVLRVLGVPVVGEAVGGRAGRSVSFDVAEGAVTVTLADGNATSL